MNKEWLDKQINEIEVPKEDVSSVIAKAISNGKKSKTKKRKMKSSLFVSTAAASLFLASGFLFTPISNVLANVPLLGSIYENFTSPVGNELYTNNLITSLNEKASNNGVDITITSAYYDGNVIGVTFKTTGKDLTIKHIDEGNRPVSGYSYHLFDGLAKNQWSSSSTDLKEMEDGFIGAVEFYNPDKQIPANFTIPLTFTSMADIKGNWKFDVPVKQIPFEKISTVYETTSKDGDYTVNMKSITKGKATTMFEYTTIVPMPGVVDEINITVFDDNKNRLSKNSTDLLNMNELNGKVEKSVRELFTSKIDENANYLMVYPEIKKVEKDTIKSLNSPTPFSIESDRFEYKINVNNIVTNEEKLTVDYTIQNISMDDFKKDIIQNFADFIKIIKTDDIKVDKQSELIDETLGFTILSDQAKRTNENELHFQSTFIIENTDDFDYADYSLMVPFGTLSSNNPIKMEPIKIDLKQ
ncbi:DUF4179 domain-containing protein [Bacillus sp. FSL K6-3431]|uniref:DUF4179 domain-containing protein n=1 Tax=Bacillus sp. FSL K6-3431 TaxID=2921500 RepID=UPI0030F66116